MKYLLLSLLLLPFAAMAQDCDLKKGTDDITSKPTLSTGFMDLQGNTLSIDVRTKEIDFFFVLTGTNVKCLNEETEVTFVMEGGKQKIELKNAGTMNCDGIFHLIFRNSAYTNSQLQRLGAKKIVSIQFVVSEGAKPYIISLVADQQLMLQKNINCVVAQAKTIL